jgi:actin-related protein
LGGAILSLIEKFDNMWITRKDYEEGGKQVVHRKCF